MSMNAIILERPGTPLRMVELPLPHPRSDQILVKVTACSVCRTDLHIVHCGSEVKRLKIGDKVGIPWLGWTCSACRFYRAGEENLCDPIWSNV